MAVVRVKGKPSLFITMTCNPDWPEIQCELLPGQCAKDRPDLVARVLNGKYRALLHDLQHGKFFGNVSAMYHVTEFQKRGLPHGHILLVLEDDEKLRCADDHDSVVSAELPDPAGNKELHDIVAKCMMHGPCGKLNESAACTHKGQRSKGFPRDFSEETMENLEGYPNYFRSGSCIQNFAHGTNNKWCCCGNCCDGSSHTAEVDPTTAH